MGPVSLKWLFGDSASVLRETNFQLLLVANVLPVLGTGLLSPILESLTGPFGASPANVGLLISFFTAPGIVMIPVGGTVADRFGRKPVLTGSLVLFGVSGALIATTTDFRVALGLRLLQGIGFAGIAPTIITMVGDFYTGAAEATAQGLRFSSSGLSGALFPLLSGLLVTVGWQYPFFLYLLALPIAVVTYLWLDEPVTEESAARADGSGVGSYAREVLALVRHRRVFAFVVARGLPVVVWIGFMTYVSIIVVQFLDGTPGEAGLLVGAGSLAFASSGSQAGRVAAYFDHLLVPLVGANLCLGSGILVVLFAPGVPVAGVGIVVAGVGFGIVLSLYRNIMTGLAPEELRAGLVSLGEASGRVAATATPIAMGSVILAATPELGFTAAVRLAGAGAAVLSTVGGIACLLVASASEPVENGQPDVFRE